MANKNYDKLMRKNNFVILAHPRSGSTTLFEIFHSQNVSIFCEPFNQNGIMKYLIHWNENSFESALDIVLNDYKGFKHLYSFVTKEQNELIKSKCNTIFLYRENLINAATSFALAFKTAVWLKDQKDANYMTNKVYINPDEIQNSINSFKTFETLKDDNCYILSYEELYYSEHGNQMKIIKEMFDFVDCEIIDYDKIKRLLDVKFNKINPDNWSDIIVNWEEIKELVKV